MAPTNAIRSGINLEGQDEQQPAYRRLVARLGALNGLLSGAAIALGILGPEVYRLAALPMAVPAVNLWLSGGLMLLLGAGAGWLTARLRRTWLTVALWLATGAMLTFLIAHIPTTLQTIAVWLADRRFWGLPVYPVPVDVAPVATLFGGMFLLLALLLLAIFQDPRLQRLGREFQGGAYPQLRAWIAFVAPLLGLTAVALITSSMIKNPYGSALSLVNRAIQVGRTYEGDLFALGLQEGMNYAAVNGVRDRLAGDYALYVGTVNAPDETVLVMATFDSGAWIKCRVVFEQLSFCEDAAPPYTVGLASLLGGAPLPADCIGCLPIVSPEVLDWLAAHQEPFQGNPRLTRLAAWGPYVLMRAAAADGRFALDCWFSGLPLVRLDRCDVLTGAAP